MGGGLVTEALADTWALMFQPRLGAPLFACSKTAMSHEYEPFTEALFPSNGFLLATLHALETAGVLLLLQVNSPMLQTILLTVSLAEDTEPCSALL